MAQRTQFPTLPNTVDAHYLSTMQAIFAELDRRGGSAPFKSFRSFLKERNLYNKEEVEDLLNLLGCEAKPNVVLGPFGRQFLAAETVESQQRLLYRWLNAWNPFLTKYVFEAVDTEGGGRLHSTHELYRMITSYVYAGEYVGLPAFQGWIKWMAASGYLKYIGIRWGLSEAGKAEMPNIRQVDVDELLEDEEEAGDAEAATDAPHLPEFGDAPARVTPSAPAKPTSETTASDASASESSAPESSAPAAAGDSAEVGTEPAAGDVESAAAGAAQVGSDDDEELPPDMPPEPSPPAWTPPPEPAKAAPARAAVPATGPATALPAWFGAAPLATEVSAAELGLDAKVHESEPGLLLFQAAIAGRLVTSGVPEPAWRPFFQAMLKLKVFQRYLVDETPLDEILAPLGFFAAKPAFRTVFSWIALDLMRIRALLRTQPRLASTLAAAEPGPAVVQLQQTVFEGSIDGAAWWVSRELRSLGVWNTGQ